MGAGENKFQISRNEILRTKKFTYFTRVYTIPVKFEI